MHPRGRAQVLAQDELRINGQRPLEVNAKACRTPLSVDECVATGAAVSGAADYD